MLNYTLRLYHHAYNALDRALVFVALHTKHRSMCAEGRAAYQAINEEIYALRLTRTTFQFRRKKKGPSY